VNQQRQESEDLSGLHPFQLSSQPLDDLAQTEELLIVLEGEFDKPSLD